MELLSRASDQNYCSTMALEKDPLLAQFRGDSVFTAEVRIPGLRKEVPDSVVVKQSPDMRKTSGFRIYCRAINWNCSSKFRTKTVSG